MGARPLTLLHGSRRTAAFVLLAGAFAACGGVSIDKQTAGASGSTGAGGAPSGSSASTASSAVGGAGGLGVVAASSSASGLPPCMSGPDEDKDGDGYTVSQGDCNDCDLNINPGAVEIIISGPLPGGDGGVPAPADDDCDGLIDNVAPLCDTGLALDDADPLSAAHAIELCKLSTGPKSWGIVTAAWVLADGAPLPTEAAQLAKYHLGHGILSEFGPNSAARLGKNLLVLSSGTARRPGDPGFQAVSGFDKGYPSGAPPGFPLSSSSCPGVVSGGPRDAVALEVHLRAPTNVGGFSFYDSVFTSSWPDRACSVFDDTFVVLQSPAPFGAVSGNITFDTQGNPLTLNVMSFDACSCVAPPCFAPPSGPTQKPYACPLGPFVLTSTGFAGSAATSWLWTAAPVKPGGDFTLRFALWDGEDGLFDTTVLVDAFRWIPTVELLPIIGEGPPI
ncbi:MAG: hypothetical protein ABJE95_38740 [Byssovorax sp.]